MPNLKLSYSYMRPFGLTLMLSATLLGVAAVPTQLQPATAQASKPASPQGSPLYIRGKVQEYDAKSQVATVRGDVELKYPSRQIQATAAQAQYFFRDRQIILSGNVYVVQQGNTIRAERVTYLIDEGRFVAQPKGNGLVQSVYMVREASPKK